MIFSAMGRIIRLLFRGTEVERRQIGGVAFVLTVVLLLLIATTVVQGAADIAGIVAGLGIPTAIAIG